MTKYTREFTTKEIDVAKSYIDKWYKILLSTQSVDRKKSEIAIENACKLLGLNIKNIFYISSPVIDVDLFTILNLCEYITPKCWLENRLLESIWKRTDDIYFSKPYGSNKYRCLEPLDGIFQSLCKIVYAELAIAFDEWSFFKILNLEFSRTNPWLYDFHFNHISNECDVEIWNAWRSLCEECPYLLAFGNTYIVIDRPCELYLDRELLPHAKGKAAIKFRDGYEIHCNHGITLPADHGKIHPSNWQSTWILEESNIEDNSELVNALLTNIGYEKFCRELPEQKFKYWDNYQILLSEGIDKITSWQLFHYYDFYHKADNSDSQTTFSHNFTNHFPFKLSQELSSLYLSYNGEYQLAPKLYFYPLKQAIENPTHGLDNYPVRLFHGDRHEIYYVLCDTEKRLTSPVYCQFPGQEPTVYAECVTSLIITIAQCYQEGAYYIVVNEVTGEKTIEQDLDKIEPIFEKFNPNQINTWRKIWKS